MGLHTITDKIDFLGTPARKCCKPYTMQSPNAEKGHK